MLEIILGTKKNYERAAEIFRSSVPDLDKLDDEAFKDMWLKHLAYTLMHIDEERSVLDAIDILRQQILWAQNEQEWSRLAAAYHRLGEAQSALAKWQSGEQRKKALLEAVATFKNAVKWDTHMLRSIFLGWDYRELAQVYFLLSKEATSDNQGHYLELARESMMEALPRLEKFNHITESVLGLVKELGIDFEITKGN